MTQNQLKVLSIFSLAGLAISIIEIHTIIAIITAFTFSYLYLSKVIKRHTERGLIQLLPQQLQNNLLHRSIFDLICDFWFFEAFRFVKLLSKPLIEPIEPDNAIQALDNISPNQKHKYLAKGIFRVMPQSCQKVLLGRQRFQQLQNIQFQVQQSGKFYKERYSQKNTDDQSQKQIPRLSKTNSQNGQLAIQRQQNDDSQLPSDRQLALKQPSHKWDRLEVFKRKARNSKNHLLANLQNSIRMIKNIIEIQSINEKIKKMNTGTIIKLTIIFWILLIAQIKFSKNTRQTVLRILYVLGGIVSVFGTVGTTGALIYKQIKYEPKALPQIQK